MQSLHLGRKKFWKNFSIFSKEFPLYIYIYLFTLYQLILQIYFNGIIQFEYSYWFSCFSMIYLYLYLYI